MVQQIITNAKIADIFEEIALFLHAENVPFKPQAYEVAAEHVRALEEELSETYRECGVKCLDAIPGIGKNLAEKIEELLTTGRLEYYNKLKKKYPIDMMELARVPNVGPRTILTFYHELGIRNLKQLERAAKTGKIAELARFGKKTEKNILQGLAFLQTDADRRVIHHILPLAEALVEKLKRVDGVTHIDIAGSLRRKKETIGDIDLLATTAQPAKLIRAFKALPEIERVVEEGTTKLAVRYRTGINGDLRILKPSEYGAALVYFTGSKEHNILLREIAIKKGMKLSEYGLFKGKKKITSKTEEEIYRKLGLQWIPPEIRLGEDEIKLAQKNNIPELIPFGSLKGDLQVQTNWTDGSASIEEMANAAKKHGLSYIAITDHTKALAMTNGLDEQRLKKQCNEIERLNRRLKNFCVLKSTECDILKNGNMDLSDDILKKLDVVSVSVHSYFSMSESEMTERIIKAFKHPLVHIFFHPTGRIVKQRKAYALDMSRIVKAAKQYHIALEVNGSERLDLSYRAIREAIEAGVKLVINSDAHAPDHFKWLEYGIGEARRGWAKKSDVLNTKSVSVFLKAIKKNND